MVAGGQSGSLLNSAELYDPTATIAIPRIVSASVQGKKLFVFGENFDPGAVILLNGVEQKTKHDGQNPETTLIGKKVGKKIKPGDKHQVRNFDGTPSEEFTFTSSREITQLCNSLRVDQCEHCHLCSMERKTCASTMYITSS